MADMQWPGGIGRDKLKQDLGASTDSAAAEPLTFGMNSAQRGGERRAREPKVDEAGARDLGARYQLVGR